MPTKRILITGGAGFVGCNAARYLRGAELERHRSRQSLQAGHRQEPGMAARRHDLRFRACRRARPRGNRSRHGRMAGSTPSSIWRPRWPSRPPSPTPAPISPSTRSAPSTCSMRSACTARRRSSSSPRPTRSTARSRARRASCAATATPISIGRTASAKPSRSTSFRPTAARRAPPISTRSTTRESTRSPRRRSGSRASTGRASSAWRIRAGLPGSPSPSLLGRDITIFGDGKQVRDVLHVDDLLRAYEAAIRAPDKIAAEAFNVGGGPGQILSLHRSDRHARDAARPQDSRASGTTGGPATSRSTSATSASSTRLLGWKPEIGVAAGITQLIDWVAQNRAAFQR